MKNVRVAFATVGWVAAAVVIGMTAVTWASGGAAGASPIPQEPPISSAIAHSPRPPSKAESVYVAITPCRIMSTAVTGNPFGVGTVRTYYVGGNFGFSAQGGHNGGCGIPVGATAIAATITAAQSQAHGYFRAWPQNLSEPNATVLSYQQSQFSQSSGATLSIQKNSALSLRVKNYGGPTNIIIDVAGYYAQQMEGMIGSDGSIYSGSDRILSATVTSPGVYRVTFDSDVTYCSPMIDTYSGKGVYGTAYAFSGTSVYVYTWYISGTTHLEVSNSYYFYITVTC